MKTSKHFPPGEANFDETQIRRSNGSERSGGSTPTRSGAWRAPSSLDAEPVSELRHERVEAIQRAVAERRYVVCSELVASRMLDALSRNTGGI